MIHTHGNVSLGIDTVGGNITSFQVSGEHIFLPQQIIKEDGQLKVRGGSHICFPNSGQLIDGHPYELPQHGFVRDSAGKIKSSIIEPGDVEKYYNVKTNGATSYVQYHFKYKGPEIEKDFPYPFKLVSNYIFLENGFLQQVIIVRRKRNHDEIPIGLGLHPYFNTEGRFVRITFGNKPEYLHIGPQDEKIENSHYPLWNKTNPNTEIELLLKGKSVKVKYGGMFESCKTSQLVIWRHNHQSPYICIEPIVCEAGDFAELGSPHLLPDESSVSAWMMVTVE